ncbi:MAG: hydrogenase maturation protease [Bacteroidota bacterium]|jgi:hydrogenase maturation protease
MIEKTSEDSKSVIENNLRKTLLISVGNEYRSDDGIGLVIARAIREKLLPSVIVKEESGEGAALMEAWQGFQNVIIVDAVSSGAMPGTIFRIDANTETVPITFFHYSTHAFSVAEAVELAKVINTLPSRLLVYGIEGAVFTAGIKISSRVKEAANQVIEQIIGEIETANR